MNGEHVKEIKALIEILEDLQANVSEKDDAAMDLGSSNHPLAVKALAAKGQDAAEDEIVLNSCGESLAEIWIRNNHFDQNLYDHLQPNAKQGARSVIENLRPAWKALYEL